MLPVRRQRGTQRAARVARRRLNPQLIEDSFTQNPTIRHAVERHAAGQAESRQARQFTGVPRQLEHDLLRHHLDGPRHVRVAWLDRRLGRARWTAEERVELFVRHHEAPQEGEVIHVQSKRSIHLHVDELLVNRPHETRLAVGREAHELVLP